MNAPTFGAHDRPADVLDVTGRWLAASLPGFRWVKSRQDVERKVPPQVHRVCLQGSTWNRAGVATWVSARLVVLDDRLLRWRRQNPEMTSIPDPQRFHSTVFNSMFVNFLPACADFEASGLPQSPGGPDVISLEEFLRCLTDNVMPVLDGFADPATVVSGLPAAWWDVFEGNAVEWSLACGDHHSAAAVIHGYLERPLRGEDSHEFRLSRFKAGWDAGRRGERAADGQFSISALGWLSWVHGLVEPDALGPPAMPHEPHRR
jgi:hypothetical protein